MKSLFDGEPNLFSPLKSLFERSEMWADEEGLSREGRCLSAVITSYDLIDLRILLYSSVSSQSERRSFRKLLVRMHGYYNRKYGVIRLRADVTTNGHKLVNADSQTFTQMIKLNLYF